MMTFIGTRLLLLEPPDRIAAAKGLVSVNLSPSQVGDSFFSNCLDVPFQVQAYKIRKKQALFWLLYLPTYLPTYLTLPILCSEYSTSDIIFLSLSRRPQLGKPEIYLFLLFGSRLRFCSHPSASFPLFSYPSVICQNTSIDHYERRHERRRSRGRGEDQYRDRHAVEISERGTVQT